MPERDLASYSAGAELGSAAVVNPTPAAGVSSDAPGAVSSSPAMLDPLAAESDRPLVERDAGAVQEAAAPDTPAPDAAPASALICSSECECEGRDGRDFMFCSTVVSFDVAVERCNAAGGTLASVDDAQQNAWLSERMQALDADDFWLSGTDAVVEGVWRWADGRVFYPSSADAGAAFAPWDDQQPNDLNGEDCMRSVGGVWRDLACNLELTYVCQG